MELEKIVIEKSKTMFAFVDRDITDLILSIHVLGEIFIAMNKS